MTLLIVDNLSPFTPEIADCLARLDVRFVTRLYDKIDMNELVRFKGVILSGRRANSKHINLINTKVISTCERESIMLLGICYGAEILALSLGGTIRPMSSKVQGTEHIRLTKPTELTTGLGNSFQVYESHAFSIARLPSSLVSVGLSNTCSYEIIANENGTLFGTQFHPEKSGATGLQLLSNFAKICN
jgi:GMP synthase (glutamine-hydrolysing)